MHGYTKSPIHLPKIKYSARQITDVAWNFRYTDIFSQYYQVYCHSVNPLARPEY